MRTLEPTADGSPTIYVPELDEHYHSVKGALTESQHVYIGCALRHRAAMGSGEALRLLEFGFGTGLNAALTMLSVGRPAVEYESLELYPLDASMAASFAASLPADVAGALGEVCGAPWDECACLRPDFRLHKRRVDFLTAQLAPSFFDVVYFDAFAPEKQPELWTPELFGRVYDAMRPGGVLTTYCAKGAVRRCLQSCGFAVERLQGPAGGKREILRAVKL